MRGTEKHSPMSEFWKGLLEYAISSVRSNSIGIHVRFGYGSSAKIQSVPLCLLMVAIIGVNVSIMHSFLLAFCHRKYFTVVFSDFISCKNDSVSCVNSFIKGKREISQAVRLGCFLQRIYF